MRWRADQLHPCTGVIQPIVVRSIGENRFEIIAGERRWRASQLARLEVVPCLVKDVADEAKTVAIALIENIQREDLNAIEEAVALQRLLTEFELTTSRLPRRWASPAPRSPTCCVSTSSTGT